MFEYHFHSRFTSAIRNGFKTQTIRRPKPEGRHPRQGERLQLLSQDGTPIAADPVCTGQYAVEISFANGQIERVLLQGVPVRDLSAFAIEEGFSDLEDMAAFFHEFGGVVHNETFHGVLIEWAPDPWELAA